MIAKLLRFALGQRFVMLVMSLALIGLGIWSFQQLKVEAYPDISDTQVVVITLYPGHAAEEVEQQVTVPVERALNGVPSVIARRSRTIFGLSVVELTFSYGTNDYFARQCYRRSDSIGCVCRQPEYAGSRWRRDGDAVQQ